jgi:hypothetical protein
MDLDGQIKLGHLLLYDRKCKSCGKIKNLIDDFYRIRKDRGAVPSSWSYECKECTKKRVSNARKTVANKMTTNIFGRWEYPDW